MAIIKKRRRKYCIEPILRLGKIMRWTTERELMSIAVTGAKWNNK